MEEKVIKLNKLLNDYIVENNLENSNIYNNIWIFYALATDLNELLKDFPTISDVKDEVINAKRFDIIEKINLIKDFYNKYDINIDIDKLIADGTIESIESNIDDKKFFYNGLNAYRDGHKIVNVCNNGTIADIPIIIHELGHFRNQTDGRPTQLRELFTESLARIDEYLFLDYLSEFGYSEEIRKFKIYLFQCYANNVYYGTPVLKMFLLFNELGDISIDSYKLYFEDTQNYEQEISIFASQIEKEEFFLNDYVYYLFDTYISSYLFSKYKENNKFIKNINDLHELVKTGDMFECLELIGLKNLDDEDRNILLNSVEEMLDSLTINKIKKTK